MTGELASSRAKARKELEELYLGVPDDSVNLTFQDLARPTIRKQQSFGFNDDHLCSDTRSKIVEKPTSPTLMAKLPSFEFNEMSHMASVSPASGTPSYQERQRPGILHSNICALCTTYIYIFRHRCLVCGRVYCRRCVRVGMGDMSEGRKCVDCLGKRYSQRYIKIAGQMGCCMGYSSKVKLQELKWAEYGPRRLREIGPSKSRSPGPLSPSRAHYPSLSPSFIMDSPYSPYTPTRHHPLPL